MGQGGEDSGTATWRNWTGLGTDIFLSRKSELSLDYLRGSHFDEPLKTDFNQAGISVDYDFTKQLSGKGGFMLTHAPSSEEITYRIYLRGSLRERLGDNLTWTNGIQAERHSANENRFDYRIIYLTRFGLQKRIKFLRLAPSVSYWLYYNIGGDKIQYYDTEGSPSIKQTADGFHRGRLILNLNSKLNNTVSVSMYYLRQNEFNLFGNARGLNVRNPSTGKIKRPFNNFNVLGLSLQFEL